MKAKVKSSGDIISVRPERDGFFVDDENNNVYKFDELEFVEEELDEETKKMAQMKSIFQSLFQMPDFNKNEMEKFWAEKHIDVIFKLLMFDTFRDMNNLESFANALACARTIMQEIKGQSLQNLKQNV